MGNNRLIENWYGGMMFRPFYRNGAFCQSGWKSRFLQKQRTDQSIQPREHKDRFRCADQADTGQFGIIDFRDPQPSVNQILGNLGVLVGGLTKWSLYVKSSDAWCWNHDDHLNQKSDSVRRTDLWQMN
jgi:hypothetical protein